MTPVPELVGDSPGIAAVRDRIGRLLARASEVRRLPPILVQGETGTGKGLVARALHRAGPRASGPFVDVNCAAIPETLLEAEMFGFERGAFTDARQAKRGLFQTAHRGTLFLDEVGLLPEGLQAKLLTVLEERSVRRLGATQSEPVDVWIIAATNTELLAATRSGRFREDLYHRLAVLTLTLPPLRERGRDVLLLAEHFLARACADYGLAPKTLAPDAREALLAFPWPGNVRELTNAMERVALLTEGSVVTAGLLGLPEARREAPARPAAAPPAEGPGTLAAAIGDTERAQLEAALEATGWNVSRAAARLGISRNTLRYRIEKHGLRPGGPPPPRRQVRPVAARPEPPPAPAPAEPAKAPMPAVIRWERRRLTLLRALAAVSAQDVVGASRAVEVFVDKVRAFGGRVEHLSPTGLLGVFGLEPAEDAARRAALAAIAIEKALHRGAGDDRAAGVRLGIHVGHFMIGRLGDTSMVDEAAAREALPTLDALLGGAPDDVIRVSAVAAPLLARRFKLVPAPGGLGGAGSFLLEGIEPTDGGAGRGGPFVGRTHDLAFLRSRLDSAVRGHGQIVAIVGEAGIGKSRLLAEFRESLVSEPLLYLQGQCVAYGASTPYHAMLEVFRATFHVAEGEGPDTVRAKVVALLGGLGIAAERSLPYVLRFLGASDGTEALAGLSRDALWTRTFDALRELVVGLSGRDPVVLVVEDLHWIDPISEEFLAFLAEVVSGTRVLLVTTHRPGHRPTWLDKSYATQLALQPLGPEDSRTVVLDVLGPAGKSEALVAAILGKAEGNPFFLEELARAIRDRRDASPSLPMPDTVEEVLLARIDRLPAGEKQLLQCAAVVGKDVRLSLLAAIADLEDEALRGHLARLKAAEFLHEVRRLPDPEYTFKHALTHEVAYRSLLPDRRSALHGRIVAALERPPAEPTAEQVELLAHHAFLAEEWDKAVRYLRRAGLTAASRSAHREAVARFEQALDALGRLPASGERAALAMDIRLDLRDSLHPLGEFERVVDHLRAAEAQAITLDDQHRLVRISAFMCQYFRLMGDLGSAIPAGERAVAIATQTGDPLLCAGANAGLGPAVAATGDHRRAVELLEGTVDSLHGALAAESLGTTGPLSVFCRIYLVCSLAELGEFGPATRRAEEALAIAEDAAHVYSLAFACYGAGTLRLLKGEIAPSVALLERGLDLCRTWTLPLISPLLASLLGEAYALSGRVGEAVSLLEGAEKQAVAMRRMGGHPMLLVRLADAYHRGGRPADAAACARRALELARAQKERGHEAHALRVLGEIASSGGDGDAEGAEALHRRAVALAEELGMRPLRARCLLALAGHHRRAGLASLADAPLAAAISEFRALEMPFWLEAAQRSGTG